VHIILIIPGFPFPREAFFIPLSSTKSTLLVHEPHPNPFPSTKSPSLVLRRGGVAKAKGGASLLTELSAAFEL